MTVRSLRGGWFVVTVLLLGVMASGAGAAVGKPATAPVTIRGSTGNSDAAISEDGASIVLRGSTPPPSPPTASDVCPPGYADVSDLGCVLPGEASYADQLDYDWDWLPFDFRNRHRAFRPRRRAFRSIAHGFPHHGRMGRR